MPPMPPEKRARIVALGRQSVPAARIARNTGVAESTVHKALRAAGIPPRFHGKAEGRAEAVIRLRRERLSVAEIAAELGCGESTVSRDISKTGEPPVRKGGRPPMGLADRDKRLLAAAASDAADRAAIAARFGFCSVGSLNSTLYRLRKEAQAGAA